MEVRSRIFGANPEIGVRSETQIEKWAFFRENTHRSFNYTKPSNLIRGFFLFVVVPAGALAIALSSQVW